MTQRQRLPSRRPSNAISFQHGGLRYVAHFSFFDTGGLAEIFLRCGKTGSAADISAHDAAVVTSIALQYGTPLAAIKHALVRLDDGSGAGPLGKLLDLIEAGDG